MVNTNQDINKTPNSRDATAKLHTKIKETWSGLSESDINLYETKPADFFAKVKEKHNVSKEDAQKKVHQLEKDCGCGSASKAA